MKVTSLVPPLMVAAASILALTQFAIAEEHTLPVQVTDSTGSSVSTLYARPSVRKNAETVTLAPAEDNGVYNVPWSSWIWSDGTSWRHIYPPSGFDGVTPLEVSLQNQSIVTFAGTDRSGTPLRLQRADVAFPEQRIWDAHGVRSEGLDGAPTLAIRSLPPGWYAFDLEGIGDESRHIARAFAQLEPGKDLTVHVEFGPPLEGSDEYYVDVIRSGRKSVAELWAELSPEARESLTSAALHYVAQLPCLLELRDIKLHEIFLLGRERKALPHLIRIYQRTPIPYTGDPIPRDFPFAIAELGGNESIPYLLEAVRNPDLDPTRRSLAIIAINRIETPESLAAWRELTARFRDGERPTHFTHADGMASALNITLNYIPQPKAPYIVRKDSANVDEDYRFGKLIASTESDPGHTQYLLKRFGGEWLVVDIEYELVV